MLDKDFYPTPPHLISRMLEGIDLNASQPILEPSAGKGDIVDYINDTYFKSHYAHNLEIDVIEIDLNLQHILRDKSCILVHDDFLTFSSSKQYRLIIANFPFSDGDKH